MEGVTGNRRKGLGTLKKLYPSIMTEELAACFSACFGDLNKTLTLLRKRRRTTLQPFEEEQAEEGPGEEDSVDLFAFVQS